MGGTLSAVVDAEPTTAIASVPVESGAARSSTSRWWLLAAAAAVLALGVGLLIAADGAPDQPAEPALSTPSTSPGTTVPAAPILTVPATSAPAVTADQGGGRGHGKKKKGQDGG